MNHIVIDMAVDDQAKANEDLQQEAFSWDIDLVRLKSRRVSKLIGKAEK